ncbi:hypothetical protein [Natrinema hispanicum]|uniref:Uncharacterized protein n=1 Tax=Natrinema hispanicum TaxID=392421 RepID=A0A1G6T5X6_9EURY|nr:hypothetical protein [Natrinema hispanicum]SDD24353.1 hypothetical protein SAMN05192552_101637 [Natrinema hispanicum]SET99677.1 hypothetical protein SAMN04488694_12431 [Natrinema hispanicum]
MAGITDPRPPLPEWILECYDRLCTQACQPEIGEDSVPLIDYDDAVTMLSSDAELALEQRDVEHALTRLLERGYFYEVEDELRVTSPEEQC